MEEELVSYKEKTKNEDLYISIYTCGSRYIFFIRNLFNQKGEAHG